MDSSHKPASKRTFVSLSKLGQKRTWDGKKHMANKRLVKKEGQGNANIPVISSESETESTRGSCNSEMETIAGTCSSESQMETTTGTRSSGYEADTTMGTQSTGVLASAMDRALEAQANLSPQFPSFVKLMLKSHVVRGFWLGLDRKFCVSHMPNDDATVILVDENGKEFEAKYLSVSHDNKVSLSGGWKGFVIAKGLQEGDVVIFQLIESRKFKIYIFEAERRTELDAAVSLLNMDSHAKPMETDQAEGSECNSETESKESEEPLPQHDPDLERILTIISNYDPATDEIDTDNGTSMTSDNGVRFSQVSFGDVKKFDDFTIQVDVLNLDSKIPIHLQRKYYKLCSSQNMFLHKYLISGLNCELVAGVIIETLKIADAIKVVKCAQTSAYDLERWDRKLKSFADLGMEVGFLRSRISKLLCLVQKSELKRRERDAKEYQMRRVEVKLESIGEEVKKLDLEICDLAADSDELDSKLKEIASARW